MTKIDFKRDILPLKDKLYRLALRITLHNEESEDIVQDTLIKLWNERDHWQQIRSIESFAITVCRNLSLDRMAKMEMRNVPLDEKLHDRPDNAPIADQQLINQQKRERVAQIIAQLPEKQRTALELRDIEEKSYNEIAEAMQISVADVKVTLFRARQNLKNRI